VVPQSDAMCADAQNTMTGVFARLSRGRFEIGCQACSSSSSALASFKESVSKPSVNQS